MDHDNVPTIVIEQDAGMKLTRPDGSAIYVNARFIANVYEATPYDGGNSVIVFTNGTRQAVTETVEQILIEIQRLKDIEHK